jgi:hypothetical protein
MDIKTKVERTFTLENITETQAVDLLNLAIETGQDKSAQEYYFNTTTLETLDALRQALLNAGVGRTEKGKV